MPKDPPPEYETEPVAGLVDTKEPEHYPYTRAEISIGSESGADVRTLVATDIPKANWDDLYQCYKESFALYRYRRMKLEARAVYWLRVRRGVVESAHADERGGIPSKMVSCLDDVLQKATYASPRARTFRLVIYFRYEEPLDAGP